MTVYDMLELCTDASEIRIRVFDCNSEEIIFDSDKLDKYDDPIMELYLSDIGSYEVSSYDLYISNGKVQLEFNIDYEPDEDEEE